MSYWSHGGYWDYTGHIEVTGAISIIIQNMEQTGQVIDRGHSSGIMVGSCRSLIGTAG